MKEEVSGSARITDHSRMSNTGSAEARCCSEKSSASILHWEITDRLSYAMPRRNTAAASDAAMLHLDLSPQRATSVSTAAKTRKKRECDAKRKRTPCTRC